MLGLQVLDLLIGLFLVFLVFSIAASAVNELIQAKLKYRSQDLKAGIESLIGQAATPQPAAGAGAGTEPAIPAPVNYTDLLLRHPLIASLTRKAGESPSYIASRTFATALLSVVSGAQNALTLADIRGNIGQLPAGSHLRTVLESLLDGTVADLAMAQKKIEVWFDDAMDRVSGWYKRRTQVFLFVIGLALASLANADSVMIANTLWQNPTVRGETVALAQNVKDVKVEEIKPEVLQTKLTSLNLLGWSSQQPRDLPTGFAGWLAKVMGMIITAAAITQGAPFWFDALKKLVNLRSTGAPPKPSGETAPGR